jgi:hypothetical protein
MNKLARYIFIIFFTTHIPITILIDGQGLFGSLYPQVLRDVFSWYVNTYNDILMKDPPKWLQAIIMAELCFQLPFFFIATYCLIKKKNWIRIPAIVYGSHTATTLLPILYEFMSATNLSFGQKVTLMSFYMPYLIIPCFLVIYFTNHAVPFPRTDKFN